MSELKVGDIVARKSYGGDILFVVTDVVENVGAKPIYSLRGLSYRISADSHGDDLIKQDNRTALLDHQRLLDGAKVRTIRGRTSLFGSFLNRLRTRPGSILHIDSSQEFLDRCMRYYKQEGLVAYGRLASESEQPGMVRQALQRYRPSILVVTGHDSIKKAAANKNSLDNYSNSRYFIESVKNARRYEANFDKLCIYGGACQSYYEGLMSAGANFASSPGRILINCYDPAIVADKVALTSTRSVVTPLQISKLVKSGEQGIWGIDTKGRMIWV